MKVSSFRYDINALRALAVLSVVLFHFFPTSLPGGFVGVDIFFVISGFLMTSIVVSRVRAKRFSLLDFYRSRLYRIVPALLVLCLLVFIFALLFVDPITLKSIGKHILSSLGFFSNYVYNAESGYFSDSSRLNWLLHTWTLSVEWQFYCVYPLLILFGYMLGGEQKLKLLLGVTLLMSLGLAIYQGIAGDRVAFFLLEYRAWELILGGFIYFVRAPPQSKTVFLQLVGLGFIALAIFIFSESMMWPSYYALLPTIGAALIIYAANSQSKLMTNSVTHKLGLWSYSIYLWHWPIVVGLVYFGFDQTQNFIIGLISSIAVGALSYHFIESKISMPKNLPQATIKALVWNKLVFFTLVLGTIGLLAFKTNGFMFRFDQTTENIVESVKASPNRNKCTSSDSDYIEPQDGCKFNLAKQNYAVFGDSHSIELAQAMSVALRDSDIGLHQYSYSACGPEYQRRDTATLCEKWTNSVVESIANDTTISKVIIIYRMSSHLFGSHSTYYPEISDNSSDEQREIIITSYKTMIDALIASGKKIILVAPVPELGESVKKMLKASLLKYGEIKPIKVGTSRDYYNRRNEYFLNVLDKLFVNNKNIEIIYPSNFFCDSKLCYEVKGGKSIYFDDDHMSMHGAGIIVNAVLETIKKPSN
ncbi:acyltransferase family protein [Paraglaciecola sp. 20A4]|uniref:acyltransferase family protein n=1 Tax=Paraglaciecola sp. 20A4 TaxID=2687288 RepID=UPI0014091F77|nr:acyltransferase family protein [Paraglaciecola sp. 20A4]